MQGLYQLNATITHFLEGFLETAVPMIAGLAEVVGLFIIITSLAKASYHYVRATFFNDHHDFHHEMRLYDDQRSGCRLGDYRTAGQCALQSRTHFRRV